MIKKEKLYLDTHRIPDFEQLNYKKLLNYLLVTRDCFPSTYHDEECCKKQCKSDKARSVGDILRIVQTYYPRVSQRAVFRELFSIVKNNKHKAFIYCDKVEKLVLYNSSFGYPPSKLGFGVVFDYSTLMKRGFEVVDKFDIFYFLMKNKISREEVKKELGIE